MYNYLIVCKPRENQRENVRYLFSKRGHKVILDTKTNYLLIEIKDGFVNDCIKILRKNSIPYEVYEL